MNRRGRKPTDLLERAATDGNDARMLSEIETAFRAGTHRGGEEPTAWEREFVENMRKLLDGGRSLSKGQREKLLELWERDSADERPPEKAQNLFSSLSPAEQERQRAAAARVKLPWET